MQNKFSYLLFSCLLMSLASAAQVSSTDNQPSEAITYKPIQKNKPVYGVFEGRPPCQEIARQLKVNVNQDCNKLKWRLFLFQDNKGQPTTYLLFGSFYREESREGKWKISKGSKTDPDAIVYELDSGQPGKTFYLLKGDDNVIFILDENKALRVGNEDFSYTLNRVKLVQRDSSELKR
ncbi:MAG TPA: hypothetical protein VKA49_18185 [Flavitalea sp.]|nr:hypothetical protein [Flavitalea sp.]